MSDKPNHGNKWMPVMYATFYGMLKDIAKDHGYALAIHGSLTNDFDLIAVAWVENPKPVLEMLQAFVDAIGFNVSKLYGKPYDSMGEKPHGRIAYTIPIGAGGYLDISVIESRPEFKGLSATQSAGLSEKLDVAISIFMKVDSPNFMVHELVDTVIMPLMKDNKQS